MRSLLMLIIGTILAIGGGISLYTAYESGDPGHAGISWAAIMLGAITILYGASRYVSNFLNPSKDLKAFHDKAEVRALVQAMGAMAAADGVIDPKEVQTISSVYKKIMGVSISDEEIDEILFDFADNFDVATRIKAHQGKISPEMKTKILQACYLVMVADLDIDAQETSKISTIGNALGFTQSEIDEITAAAAI